MTTFEHSLMYDMEPLNAHLVEVAVSWKRLAHVALVHQSDRDAVDELCNGGDTRIYIRVVSQALWLGGCYMEVTEEDVNMSPAYFASRRPTHTTQ